MTGMKINHFGLKSIANLARIGEKAIFIENILKYGKNFDEEYFRYKKIFIIVYILFILNCSSVR